MTAGKVFFLALEAANPDLLVRWMDDGSLPNLAALRERSFQGDIQSLRGIGANALWPSVYTGVDPANHGRYYHRQLQGDGYDAGEQHQKQVLHQTIWELASDAGQRVAIIDLPKCPTSERLNGIQIVDWQTHYSYADEFQTVPPSLCDAVVAEYGAKARCPCLDKRYIETDPASSADIVSELLRGITNTQTMLSGQLRGNSWDLCMASFSALHCAGHHLWHMHDTCHPWHYTAVATEHNPLHDVYRAIDDAVGAVLDELPRDSAVILLAGPGMGPSYVRTDLLDDILNSLESGRASPARGLNKTLKYLWHGIPQSWRQLLSGPAHSLEDKLKARDRSGRRYFSVQTNDNVGGIRVNLKGREPDGLVAHDDLDRTCDELMEIIGRIHIVDSGEPLVRDVFRTSSAYQGKYLAQLPDILIEWNQPSRITAVESPEIGVIGQDRMPDLSGTHTGEMFALINLPGNGTGVLPSDASALDIAPTIAALCGLESPGLPGRVLVPVGRS